MNDLIYTLEFLYSALTVPADRQLIRNLKKADYHRMYGSQEIITDLKRSLDDVYSETDENALLAEWIKLWRPVTFSDMLPPLEAAVLAPRSQHKALHEINTVYMSCSFRLSDYCNERHDHISTQIAFLLLLLQHNTPDREIVIEHFLNEHMGVWVPVFCDSVSAYIKSAYNRAFISYLDSLFSPKSEFFVLPKEVTNEI